MQWTAQAFKIKVLKSISSKIQQVPTILLKACCLIKLAYTSCQPKPFSLCRIFTDIRLSNFKGKVFPKQAWIKVIMFPFLIIEPYGHIGSI